MMKLSKPNQTDLSNILSAINGVSRKLQKEFLHNLFLQNFVQSS